MEEDLDAHHSTYQPFDGLVLAMDYHPSPFGPFYCPSRPSTGTSPKSARFRHLVIPGDQRADELDGGLMARYTVVFRTDEDSSQNGRPGWRTYMVDAKSPQGAIQEAYAKNGGLQELMRKGNVKMRGDISGQLERNRTSHAYGSLSRGSTGSAVAQWEFVWDGKDDFRLSRRD